MDAGNIFEVCAIWNGQGHSCLTVPVNSIIRFCEWITDVTPNLVLPSFSFRFFAVEFVVNVDLRHYMLPRFTVDWQGYGMAYLWIPHVKATASVMPSFGQVKSEGGRRLCRCHASFLCRPLHVLPASCENSTQHTLQILTYIGLTEC